MINDMASPGYLINESLLLHSIEKLVNLLDGSNDECCCEYCSCRDEINQNISQMLSILKGMMGIPKPSNVESNNEDLFRFILLHSTDVSSGSCEDGSEFESESPPV